MAVRTPANEVQERDTMIPGLQTVWSRITSPNPTETTDEELAAACARRDESLHLRRLAETAFEILYDRHAKRLIAFLGGRVSMAVLDDVNQDVWVRVWQTLPTGFRGGNFR